MQLLVRLQTIQLLSDRFGQFLPKLQCYTHIKKTQIYIIHGYLPMLGTLQIQRRQVNAGTGYIISICKAVLVLKVYLWQVCFCYNCSTHYSYPYPNSKSKNKEDEKLPDLFESQTSILDYTTIMLTWGLRENYSEYNCFSINSWFYFTVVTLTRRRWVVKSSDSNRQWIVGWY